MFRWYQQSQVCYAYLSDVPAEEKPGNILDDLKFSKSMWFTRGWTLQELLAPEIVVFYNCDWVEIGTRATLHRLISSITNIAQRFLSGPTQIQNASAAQKMSWASTRKTTRLEDTAYCLMGLFNVNMPLLYGEGKAAFRRLQIEIINNSPDESIFAWGNLNRNPNPTEWNNKDLLGLLAEEPALFEGSGDIVQDYNARPPYTMTNQGLNIGARLVPTSDYFKGEMMVAKHVMFLSCHQAVQRGNKIAIFLDEGYLDTFYRTSTSLALLPAPLSNATTNKPLWEYIIIWADVGHPYLTLRPEKWWSQPFVLIDIGPISELGYSTPFQDQNFIEVGTQIIRIQIKYKHLFRLEFRKPKASFVLVLLLHDQVPQIGFFSEHEYDQIPAVQSIARKMIKANARNELLLPDGSVLHAVLKKKMFFGEPNYLVEMKI
jgi:hypothetical protein